MEDKVVCVCVAMASGSLLCLYYNEWQGDVGPCISLLFRLMDTHSTPLVQLLCIRCLATLASAVDDPAPAQRELLERAPAHVGAEPAFEPTVRHALECLARRQVW